MIGPIIGNVVVHDLNLSPFIDECHLLRDNNWGRLTQPDLVDILRHHWSST